MERLAAGITSSARGIDRRRCTSGQNSWQYFKTDANERQSERASARCRPQTRSLRAAELVKTCKQNCARFFVFVFARGVLIAGAQHGTQGEFFKQCRSAHVEAPRQITTHTAGVARLTARQQP